MTAMFRKATIERLKDRVRDLNQHFARSLSTFEQVNLFTGPRAFHRRTVDHLRTMVQLSENASTTPYLQARRTRDVQRGRRETQSDLGIQTDRLNIELRHRGKRRP